MIKTSSEIAAAPYPRNHSRERLRPREPENGQCENSSSQSIRVLIVDDISTNRVILSHMIRKMGAAATTCESGEEALKILAGEKFELILMDLHMPEMSGFECGEKIIEKRTGKLPLLIAQTADETPTACKRTSEIGFDGHISKPIRPNKLTGIFDLLKELSPTS